MSAYVYRVGLVSKPHGLEGHVSVRLFRPRRDKSHKTKSVRGRVTVALATEDGAEDTFVLESVRFVDPSRVVVRLADVDRDRAEALAGRYFDLDPAQLPGVLVDDVDRAYGATAIDDTTQETIGVVADVRDNGAQSMLVIERPDGGEVLIPYVEAFVAGLDADGRLHLTPLPGLLDLE